MILTSGIPRSFEDVVCLPPAATLITKRDRTMETVRNHAFVIWDWVTPITVVPSGFTSGYNGAGPKGLMYALMMLRAKDIPIYELEVDGGLFDRLSQTRLTDADLKRLTDGGQRNHLFFGSYTDSFAESDSAASSQIFDKYLPYLYGALPRVGWELLDQEIAEKSEMLARISMRSALVEAFFVLKSRLVAKYGVSATLDGTDLVNKIFGGNGVILAGSVDEDLRKDTEAMRDLLAGLFKVFRNKYSLGSVDVPWFEAEAVFTMINWVLIRLDVLESNRRRRTYLGAASIPGNG